jgi:hypothetical protein
LHGLPGPVGQFRTVVPAEPGTFELLAGKPREYVKTGESGNQREQTFCGDCGSPICSGPPGEGGKVVSLRAGTIRQRQQLVPGDQYWFRFALAWLRELPFDRQARDATRVRPQGRLRALTRPMVAQG